jgi:LPXTG-motif cell wall-anchored protein
MINVRTQFSPSGSKSKVKMKKYLPILALALLVSAASATTISQENVVIDLEDNTVNAEVNVELLTSSAFTYTSTEKVEGLNASLDGEPIDCRVSDLALGSEIECPTDKRENFTVNLEYTSGDLISQRDSVNVFRYRHPVYRPTEGYDLEVILPMGTALLDQENTSQQVISPQGFETSSNGRRISVEWDLQPRLGETISFFVLYRDFGGEQEDSRTNSEVLAMILGGLFLLIVSAALLLRRKRRDLSEKYEELSEDEKKVLNILEENEGEYLQKDLVEELDYSKAKVSGTVSDLVEKGVLKKSKEGRSNKLSISRKYRY